jgi:hypothetical protein
MDEMGEFVTTVASSSITAALLLIRQKVEIFPTLKYQIVN